MSPARAGTLKVVPSILSWEIKKLILEQQQDLNCLQLLTCIFCWLRLLCDTYIFSVELLYKTTPVGTCNSERFDGAYISGPVYTYVICLKDGWLYFARFIHAEFFRLHLFSELGGVSSNNTWSDIFSFYQSCRYLASFVNKQRSKEGFCGKNVLTSFTTDCVYNTSWICTLLLTVSFYNEDRVRPKCCLLRGNAV